MMQMQTEQRYCRPSVPHKHRGRGESSSSRTKNPAKRRRSCVLDTTRITEIAKYLPMVGGGLQGSSATPHPARWGAKPERCCQSVRDREALSLWCNAGQRRRIGPHQPSPAAGTQGRRRARWRHNPRTPLLSVAGRSWGICERAPPLEDCDGNWRGWREKGEGAASHLGIRRRRELGGNKRQRETRETREKASGARSVTPSSTLCLGGRLSSGVVARNGAAPSAPSPVTTPPPPAPPMPPSRLLVVPVLRNHAHGSDTAANRWTLPPAPTHPNPSPDGSSPCFLFLLPLPPADEVDGSRDCAPPVWNVACRRACHWLWW